MIGVVVWSNAEREKAVIWCEDQGALAYLHSWQNLAAGMAWPVAGDLLELESETIGDLRYARSVSMLNRQHCVELPSMLIDAQPEETPLRLVISDGKCVDRSRRDDDREARQVKLRRLAACGS